MSFQYIMYNAALQSKFPYSHPFQVFHERCCAVACRGSRGFVWSCVHMIGHCWMVNVVEELLGRLRWVKAFEMHVELQLYTPDVNVRPGIGLS